MISVKLTKDATQKTASGYLWQWDYGQQLQVSGIEFPTVTEVHFATGNDTKASRTVGTVSDEVLTVNIPDECLIEPSLADYFIKAYIYITDDESGTTTYRIDIPVKHRARGAYVTPVRTEPDAFDKMISSVEKIAEKAQASADSAAEAATTAVKEAVEEFQEDVGANTAARHTHSNKAVLDGITADKVSQWDKTFDGDYNSLTNKPSIPSKLAELTDDATHRTVTDTEKATWSGKSDFSGSYNDLTNKPTIPTVPTSDINANTSARHTHSNKSVLDGISSAKVSAWDAKSDFSGSYNDLTNKPTIPNVPTYGTGLTLSNNTLSVDDTHINSLIKSQLEEVENGTY